MAILGKALITLYKLNSIGYSWQGIPAVGSTVLLNITYKLHIGKEILYWKNINLTSYKECPAPTMKKKINILNMCIASVRIKILFFCHVHIGRQDKLSARSKPMCRGYLQQHVRWDYGQALFTGQATLGSSPCNISLSEVYPEMFLHGDNPCVTGLLTLSYTLVNFAYTFLQQSITCSVSWITNWGSSYSCVIAENIFFMFYNLSNNHL